MFSLSFSVNTARDTIQATKRKVVVIASRAWALFWYHSYWARYRFLVWKTRHGYAALSAIGFLIVGVSMYFAPVFQTFLEPRFSDQTKLVNLQAVFLNVGSALIGAAAIAFSLVMFAMQVNVERMPHGLFRKLSADIRILSAFAGTFLLAIFVACVSLIPDKSWIAAAILASAWATALILVLFLYAYRRALLLINPIKQLNLLVDDAIRGMRIWVRWAKRAAPLYESPDETDDDRSLRSTHDLPRLVYFQKNPDWSNGAHQAITHAMSFARRYAEQGDHEVCGAALTALIKINQGYVEAKGKTFFADHAFVDNPLTHDGFISATLEHLRQNIRIGLSRGDEQQLQQTFQALAVLVQVYLQIDYSNPRASKTHAHLAASYLSDSVKSVAPHNMPDVLMEGLRLMGKSAQSFLVQGTPSDIGTLVDEIATVGYTGAMNEKYRPITLVAIQQLARLLNSVLQSNKQNVRFAADKLKANITMIAKLFLNVPDMPLAMVHHTYLAPYYSSTTNESFLSWLTNFANVIAESGHNDQAAKVFIRNIENWADGLYQNEKELLLLAIEKRSSFTFDVISWISHVTKLLLALSNVPACEADTRDNLRKHALWLISVLSWIPDDQETINFVESWQVTETLFEVAIDAHQRNCLEESIKIRELLFKWAFKAGRYQIGWGILERSLYGLATLAVLMDGPARIENLKQKISDRLTQADAPDPDLLHRTARNMRDRAATFYPDAHSASVIENEMGRLDPRVLSPLLEQIADILSPLNSRT